MVRTGATRRTPFAVVSDRPRPQANQSTADYGGDKAERQHGKSVLERESLCQGIFAGRTRYHQRCGRQRARLSIGDRQAWRNRICASTPSGLGSSLSMGHRRCACASRSSLPSCFATISRSELWAANAFIGSFRYLPNLAVCLLDIRGTYLPTGLGQFGEFGRRPPRERRPVPGRRAFYTPSVHNTDFNS